MYVGVDWWDVCVVCGWRFWVVVDVGMWGGCGVVFVGEMFGGVVGELGGGVGWFGDDLCGMDCGGEEFWWSGGGVFSDVGGWVVGEVCVGWWWVGEGGVGGVVFVVLLCGDVVWWGIGGLLCVGGWIFICECDGDIW